MAALAMPFIKFDSSKNWSLESIKNNFSEGEEYWKQVRKQFPLKEGQTYFNNGTMGPTPGYVLDKMINHMMYYNTEAATIDYKDGSDTVYVHLRLNISKDSNLVGMGTTSATITATGTTA